VVVLACRAWVLLIGIPFKSFLLSLSLCACVCVSMALEAAGGHTTHTTEEEVEEEEEKKKQRKTTDRDYYNNNVRSNRFDFLAFLAFLAFFFLAFAFANVVKVFDHIERTPPPSNRPIGNRSTV
jgi:hypothetical protein